MRAASIFTSRIEDDVHLLNEIFHARISSSLLFITFIVDSVYETN